MTGQPSTLFFSLSFLIFFLYAAKRMFTLPSMVKQRVEAEMIMRKEMIYGQNQTKNAIRFYFRSLFRTLVVVMFCVFASAFNLLLMFLSIKTGEVPSPLWLVVLVVFIFLLPSFVIVGAKMLDTKTLKDDIMIRFTD